MLTFVDVDAIIALEDMYRTQRLTSKRTQQPGGTKQRATEMGDSYAAILTKYNWVGGTFVVAT